MAELGFVGLGVMGGRIAKRLLDAGHDVVGYNRTRAKAEWLAGSGMRFADSPREVAEQSDIVFSMVTDGVALTAVTDGPDGLLAGLGPGKIHVDMSSVSPPASRDLAERVEATGARMLDCARVGQREDARGREALRDGGRRRSHLPRGGAASPEHRADRHLRRGTRAGGGYEDRDQPQPGRADARVQRGRAPGGEERDQPQDRRGRPAEERDRVADDPLPGPVRPRAAGRGVVRRQHDAEGPPGGARDGAVARRPVADHRRSRTRC